MSAIANKGNPVSDYQPVVLAEDTLPEPLRDIVSATLIYEGRVLRPGVDETDPEWAITKLEQIGAVWTPKYAGGLRGNYTFKWSERASLTNYGR